MRRTLTRLALVSALAAATAACASLQPYGPVTAPGGQGYVEQRIESDRWRVSYRGVGAPEPVADYALYRAAELTLAQGHDWFEITQRWTDGRPDSAGGIRPSLSIGAGSGRYGLYSGSGVGVGVGLNFTGPSPTSTQLEVLMGDGAPPERTTVYDARGVLAALSGRVLP